MTLTLDLIAAISLVAAINLLYVAGVSYFEARELATSRLFALLALVGVWWTGCLGLAFTDLGLAEPRLFQTSQLFSGFFGPLLFLFTLAYIRRPVRPGLRLVAILLPGLFGTTSFAAITLLDPPAYRELTLRFLHGQGGFDLSAVRETLPWYELLQRAHSIELFLYTIASIVVFARWSRARASARARASDRDRVDGGILAGLFATMLVGIVVTNILPGAGFSASWPRFSPILSLPFCLLLLRFVRQRARSVESLQRERERLLAYVPVSAVESSDEAGDPLSALERPRQTDAVVLFADLKGFTTMSETLAPEALVAWVDAFFSRMSGTILAEQGMVDKLIGDAVLAIFGVLPALDDPASAAVRCAEAMQEALSELNAEYPPAPGVVMEMGIGLHHGPLVAGSVGSAARRAYTVFGDTVNTASRLEGLTRRFDARILGSRALVERLPEALATRFEDLGEQPIRGRHGTLQVYRL